MGQYSKVPYDVHVVSNQRSKTWRPGYFATLPWTAILALCGVVLLAAASTAILLHSDHKSTESWPSASLSQFTPTVILAIISVLSNVLLRYAVAEAWTIIWWRRTLKPRPLSQLHNNWAFGHSILDALASGRNFNLIAFGRIIVTVAVAQGPLLQRASQTVLQTRDRDVSIAAQITPYQLSFGFSGLTTGRSTGIHLLTSKFIPAVRAFNNRSPITINYTGCTGTCTASFVAPGFDISCQYNTTPYNISHIPGNTDDVFGVNIGYGHRMDSHRIDVGATYKPHEETNCTGLLKTTRCTLREGIMRYNATLANSTVILDPITINQNNTIELQYYGSDNAGMGHWSSTIGGIYLAAANRYNSNASLTFSGGPMTVSGNGTLYTDYIDSDADKFGTCEMSWVDPVPEILTGIRELMFRAALEDTKPDNASYTQVIRGRETIVLTEYKSDFKFLAIALVFPLAATLVVFVMMLGWWELGRVVTLSPVEIAKALRAPVLEHAGSNTKVEGILKQVGDVYVRYGENERGRLEIGPVQEIDRPMNGKDYW